jgi:uncharacterized surface protein with fasciclin (FAS1) repeats
MNFKLKMALISIASSLAVVAVPMSASAHAMHDEVSQPNIIETAVSINQKSGEFSTLIAAVSCTNLINRLQNEDRNFTVFAPTDAAFAKLGLNAGNVCASFDEDTLQNILEYHISRGTKLAEDILSRNKLRMLNGERAPISGATIAGQNIIMTDVEASNGVIHVIDGVMIAN